MIDEAIRARFTHYLSRSETIRWTGRPQQGLAFRAQDMFLIPFSLIWCGFVVLWTMAALSAAPFLVLWGLMFVAFGLYLFAGRFVADALLRAKTYYALTDERALILSGLFSPRFTAVDLAATSEIHVRGGGGRPGTIVFGPDIGPWRHAAAWGHWRRSPEFFRVADVDAAYQAILARQRRTRPS